MPGRTFGKRRGRERERLSDLLYLDLLPWRIGTRGTQSRDKGSEEEKCHAGRKYQDAFKVDYIGLVETESE